MAKTLGKVFTVGRIIGLVLLLAGFLVWYFRPLAHCSWWNLLCWSSSALISPIFLILSIILVIIGVIKLIKG